MIAVKRLCANVLACNSGAADGQVHPGCAARIPEELHIAALLRCGKAETHCFRGDSEPVALGGMWEIWWSDGETLRTSATLTTEANSSLALDPGSDAGDH